MQQFRMSGSVGTSGEQSPEVPRPELLPLPPLESNTLIRPRCLGHGLHGLPGSALRMPLFLSCDRRHDVICKMAPASSLRLVSSCPLCNALPGTTVIERLIWPGGALMTQTCMHLDA